MLKTKKAYLYSCLWTENFKAESRSWQLKWRRIIRQHTFSSLKTS